MVWAIFPTRSGVPTAVLMHTFAGWFYTWAPTRIWGALRGLPQRRIWGRAAAVIVASDRALDPMTDPAPGTLHWVGPAEPEAAPAVVPDRPRVLVSLSTTAIAGQERELQRIIESLAPLDADLAD